MSIPIFKSFMPTVARWVSSAWRHEYRVLVDNSTGAPIGLVSPSANGPEGIWAPTPLSQAQIVAPSAAVLADLNATYQLNEFPYSRYRSDGTQLLSMDETGSWVIPAGENVVMFSPLVITADNSPLVIQGGLRVIE